MRMLVLAEDLSEDGGAGGEHHPVGLQLTLLAGHGHVQQLCVTLELLEGCHKTRLKMLPSQTEIIHDEAQSQVVSAQCLQCAELTGCDWKVAST